MTAQRIRPFDGSYHQAAWEEYNCIARGKKCALYGEAGDCDILHGIAGACIGDGTVSADIARRMGYTPKFDLYRCGEFTPENTEA